MAAVQSPVPTPFTQLNAVIARIKDQARAFARLTLDDRIRLVESMLDGYVQVAEESVIAACQAKGVDPRSPVAGEEWLGGPMATLRILRLTLESLREVKKHGAPRLDRSWFFTLDDGRTALRVFPHTRLDAALLAGHTAEVHFERGMTPETVRARQAAFYRKPHDGKLCVVLGAGNVNAIAPTDVLYKLFVEGTVCVLKMNPVNAYLGPFIERAFRSLIERGFLAVTYGGADEGAYLVQHPAVDEVHVTGSDRTYDQMVWGPPGPERDARKQRNEPLLTKDVTAELGNISPLLIVPGPYGDGDLDFQGRNIAGMVANNASFNCNAAKLLVTPQGWDRRRAFLDAIERGLRRAPVRKAYYPGAEERWRQFTDGRRSLEVIGEAGAGELPYALILGVDARDTQDRVFHQEPWCTVLSETSLEAAEPIAFLEHAVRFLNEQLWGTLNATVIIHPATLKDARVREAFERALLQLRYGTVTVNTWPGTGFGLGVTPWGGHPSATPRDIQSGRGWVHNTLMLDGIEKTVIRAPLKSFPPWPWFAGHRTVDRLARNLTFFEAAPSWPKLAGVAAAALRG